MPICRASAQFWIAAVRILDDVATARYVNSASRRKHARLVALMSVQIRKSCNFASLGAGRTTSDELREVEPPAPPILRTMTDKQKALLHNHIHAA